MIHTFAAAVVHIVNLAYRHVACMDYFVELLVFVCFAFYYLVKACSAFYYRVHACFAFCSVNACLALYCLANAFCLFDDHHMTFSRHCMTFFDPGTSSKVDLLGVGPFVGVYFVFAVG